MEKFISDPEARKPEDWDENQPRQVLDEAATMPDGWLVDEESMVIIPGLFYWTCTVQWHFK